MKKYLLPFMLMVTFDLMPTAQAQTQTCDPNIPATAPDSRYTDHGNGTVTDNATGLMWTQCAEGLSGSGCGSGSIQTFTWQEALQQAQAAAFAGHVDWRLPNVKELASLVERRCYDPAINLARFPKTPSSNFWSSSPEIDVSDYAWGVFFSDGSVDFDFRYYNYSVRLVRGGQ